MKFIGITLEFRINLSLIFEQEMLQILNYISVVHSCCLVFLLKRILRDIDAEKENPSGGRYYRHWLLFAGILGNKD